MNKTVRWWQPQLWPTPSLVGTNPSVEGQHRVSAIASKVIFSCGKHIFSIEVAFYLQLLVLPMPEGIAIEMVIHHSCISTLLHSNTGI